MASPYVPSQGDILGFLPSTDHGQPAIYTVTEVVTPPGYNTIGPMTGALCSGANSPPTNILPGAICPGPTTGPMYRRLTLLLPQNQLVPGGPLVSEDQAVSGTMTISLHGNDSQLATSGAKFSVTRLYPTPMVPPATYTQLAVSATTTCSGSSCSTSSATIAGLLPGAYEVTQSSAPPGYSDSFSSAEIIQVAPGTTTAAPANFSDEAVLGQITVSDTGDDTPFLPTGGAQVTISGGPMGGIVNAMPSSLRTTWDQSCLCATATFTSLMPGTYTVGVSSPSSGYENPTFETATITTTNITVTPGNTSSANLSEHYVAGSILVSVYFNQALSSAPPSATIKIVGPTPVVTTVTCSPTTPYGTGCSAVANNLQPGIYTVSETGVPSGFTLWGDPGSGSGDSQQVIVEPGQSYPTTVEFYNIIE